MPEGIICLLVKATYTAFGFEQHNSSRQAMMYINGGISCYWRVFPDFSVTKPKYLLITRITE